MDERPSSVILSAGLPGALVDLARRAAPREACGFLVGPPPPKGAALRIDRLIVVSNAETGTERFRVAAPDFVRAQKRARVRGDRLLGVFHGHPAAGPIPSSADLEAAGALGEGVRRIDIIAGREGESWVLAAWSLGPNGVRRLPWFEAGAVPRRSRP